MYVLSGLGSSKLYQVCKIFFKKIKNEYYMLLNTLWGRVSI